MKKIILVDKHAKVEKWRRGELHIISIDLTDSALTFPDTASFASIFFAISDSKVVLPAPEGPIIANISPGLQ